MTGETTTRKKGMLSGFLAGSAICLIVAAGASYLVPGGVGATQSSKPEAPTTEIAEQITEDEGAQVAIITPKSDTTRVTPETPEAEAPEEDRDIPDVAQATVDVSEPVQTDTSTMEAPLDIAALDAETAEEEAPLPETQPAVTLETIEDAPEKSVELVTLAPSNEQLDLPDSEQFAIEQPVDPDEPVGIALEAPVVGKSDVGVAPQLEETVETDRGVSDLPALQAEITSPEALPSPSAPIAIEAPTAEPVVVTTDNSNTQLRVPSEPETAKDDTTTGALTDLTDGDSFGADRTASNPVLAAPKDIEINIDAGEASQGSRLDQANEVADGASDGEETQLAAISPDSVEEEIALQPPSDNDNAQQSDAADSRNPPPPVFEGRAFDAFAVRFIPPNNKPYLSIVLEHVTGDSVSMYDLLNFGQPIAFGVNVQDELSRWRENEFRKAGFEVVALAPNDTDAGLSESIQDALIPSRLDGYLTAVPGAVAVLDSIGSDIYRDPRKVARVANELDLTGRGFLVHERFGVNRALEAARSVGIPAASLVRVIDQQRDASSIRRALDRAALDASKTGAAIVFGRTYPETIAAILPWLLGNSAKSVTIAPLTLTMNRLVE